MNATNLFRSSLACLLVGVCVPTAAAYSGMGQGVLQGTQVNASPAELLRAARGGDVESMRILGKMLIEGKGVKRDVKNGVKWMKMAAEEGDAGAMLIMGDLYRNGTGVPHDMEKAVEYYILADENGNKTAAKRLNKLSLEESLPWWEKKVADGNKKATLKLMLAHATGDEIPQDLDKAKDLYELANKKWPKDTEKALEKLPEDISAELSGSGDAFKLTPVERIASEYYMNGTEEYCRKQYLEDLERLKKALVRVSFNRGDIGECYQDIVGCWASAELYRLTLISKYGVSAKELERISLDVRKKIKEESDAISSRIDMNNVQAGDFECAGAISFITRGYGGKNVYAYQSGVTNSCCFLAQITVGELKKVRSSGDGSHAMTATFASMRHRCVCNYIAATCPEAAVPEINARYKKLVSAIKSEIDRISRAGYFNNATIEDYVKNCISKSYQF